MTCAHTWISNSGDGGKPEFLWLWGSRVMKVRCFICRILAWVTPKEWNSLNVSSDQGSLTPQEK